VKIPVAQVSAVASVVALGVRGCVLKKKTNQTARSVWRVRPPVRSHGGRWLMRSTLRSSEVGTFVVVSVSVDETVLVPESEHGGVHPFGSHASVGLYMVRDGLGNELVVEVDRRSLPERR
jgi:hypothetical protein